MKKKKEERKNDHSGQKGFPFPRGPLSAKGEKGGYFSCKINRKCSCVCVCGGFRDARRPGQILPMTVKSSVGVFDSCANGEEKLRKTLRSMGRTDGAGDWKKVFFIPDSRLD